MNHSAARRVKALAGHRIARRHRHQRRHREQGDHRPVAGRLRVGDRLAEEAAQVVIAADALAADEDLGRGRHPMLRLEGVGLLAGGEVMVLDLVAGALQQVLRLEPVGADMVRHHHAVDDRLLRRRGRLGAGEGWSCPTFRVSLRSCRHGYRFRTMVRSQGVNSARPSASSPPRAASASKRSASTSAGACSGRQRARAGSGATARRTFAACGSSGRRRRPASRSRRSGNCWSWTPARTAAAPASLREARSQPSTPRSPSSSAPAMRFGGWRANAGKEAPGRARSWLPSTSDVGEAFLRPRRIPAPSREPLYPTQPWVFVAIASKIRRENNLQHRTTLLTLIVADIVIIVHSPATISTQRNLRKACALAAR